MGDLERVLWNWEWRRELMGCVVAKSGLKECGCPGILIRRRNILMPGDRDGEYRR